MKAPPLERQARALLATIFEHPDDPLAITAASNPRRTGVDVNATERARIHVQLDTLLDMRQHGEISREQLLERRKPLDRRLRELEAVTKPSDRALTIPRPEMARRARESTNLELAELLDVLNAVFRVNADRAGLKLVSYTPLPQ